MLLRLPPVIKSFNPTTEKQHLIVPLPIFMEVPQIFTKIIKSKDIYETSVIVEFYNLNKKYEGK